MFGLFARAGSVRYIMRSGKLCKVKASRRYYTGVEMKSSRKTTKIPKDTLARGILKELLHCIWLEQPICGDTDALRINANAHVTCILESSRLTTEDRVCRRAGVIRPLLMRLQLLPVAAL